MSDSPHPEKDQRFEGALGRAFEVTAKEDFDHALRKGFWHSVINWFTHKDNSLLPFDVVRQSLPVHGQHDVGMRQIPLDKIIGSVGRYQDFDRAFLPLRGNTRGRWISIDRAHIQDISLPPIDVYEVGGVYFVKDGNHRVSVARERGQAYIDAYVTAIDVPFEIDTDTNINELILRSEAANFMQKTALQELRPASKVVFTIPEGWPKALEHIDVHRWYMGEKRKGEVPYAEAVASWYDEVYMPLVRVLRRSDILGDFPGRTESDLYLWVIEHLYYLREEYNKEISLEEATASYARDFAEKQNNWWVNFMRRLIARFAGD